MQYLVCGYKLLAKGDVLFWQARKEHKLKLLGADLFRWEGVFHVNGWEAKSSVFPWRPRGNKLFGGIFREFWLGNRGGAEEVEKNNQRTAKGASGRGHVKKSQKVSNIFFDTC